MGEIVITRRNGGLGRVAPSEDGISGLALNLPSSNFSTSYAGNSIYEVNSMTDVQEQFEINAQSSDYVEKLVYKVLNDYFRLTSGKLFLMITEAVALADIVDKTKNYATKLLRDESVKGSVRQLGVFDAVNTDPVFVETSGVYSGPGVKAQELALEEEILHRPVIICLDIPDFSGSGTGALDLRASKCNHVAVNVAGFEVEDNSSNTQVKGSMGAFLGMISRRKVNECIGFVGTEDSPINGDVQDSENYVIPILTSGLSVSTYSQTDLDQLDAKGYNYMRQYAGSSGVFYNDSHTCGESTDDYAKIENVRTIHKAIRIAYKALVPYINSTIQIADDGTLPASVCSNFQNVVGVALRKDMQVPGEVSPGNDAIDVYVNPQQNLISTSEIEVEVEIIPTGVARKIKVPIGFKNPFKSN